MVRNLLCVKYRDKRWGRARVPENQPNQGETLRARVFITVLFVALVIGGIGARLTGTSITSDAAGRPSPVLPSPTLVPTHTILHEADGPPPAPTATKVPTPKPTATRVPTRVVASAASRAKYVVLFVLDGAQPSYLHISGIPHVKALMRNGTEYTNAWAGILESETPSGHATIGSGSQPRNDGILSFDWANSDNIPVSVFNENAIRSGHMENMMKTAPSPSIASLVHRENPKAKVVALSGYKYYAADAIGGPGC
jgi:Type I phosphodiesterase / nucleotide pyrophosphatase